jgi:flagellar basal-body rod protein FlgB
MAFDLNGYLGLHATSLELSARRTEILAANVANADTPGFKARDVDFRAALAAADTSAAAGGQSLRVTHANHLTANGTRSGADATSHLLFRTPLAPSLDGNTVDLQLEQAQFAANTVRYQASLAFLNSKLRSLLTAITGQ